METETAVVEGAVVADAVPAVPDVPAAEGSEAPKLSKNKLRKLRRTEMWEAGRDKRKQKRREKRVNRREVRKAAALANPGAEAPAAPAKRQRLDNEELPPPDMTVVVDCSFDDLMQEKEIASLSRQIETMYSVNRRSPRPLDIGITSFGGQLLKRFDRFIGVRDKWKHCTFNEKHLIDSYPKDKIVYLSAESPDVITTLQPGAVYVIGGLVDHNQHKGLCYARAQAAGIATARLPIDEHMKIATRKVLAVNHVFEILSKVHEDGDWAQALATTIPTRKQFQLHEGGAPAEGEQAEEDKEEDDEDGHSQDSEDDGSSEEENENA